MKQIPENIYAENFVAKNNCLYDVRTNRQGSNERKLCNFVPWLVREVTMDDGVETTTRIALAGVHESGRTLPVVEMRTEDLSSFNWLNKHWGIDCIIEPGTLVKDVIRYAIQTTAHNATRSMVYTVTGWRELEDGWKFLMPGDEAVTVSLPGKMQGYNMERHWEKVDIATSLALLDSKVAPPEILFPMLAFAFLSPLNHFLKLTGHEPKFVLFLVGKTGSRKSTLAALFLSFFGRFTGTELPLSFRDTSNSILNHAFSLKDVLTCIDDFHPAGRQEENKLTASAQSIMRAYGDRTGRGRLNSDSTPMETRPPRGNAIITGEFPPDIGESGTARYFSLELHDGDVDLDELTMFQEEASKGVLQRCMFSFVEWLKETCLYNKDAETKFISALKKLFEARRSVFQKACPACHGRVPESAAWLEIGMELYLSFTAARLELPKSDLDGYRNQFHELLVRLCKQQAENVRQDRPTHKFIRKLYALLESGQCCLLSRYTTDDYIPPNCIGYEDDMFLYLHSEPAHRLVRKFCEEQGESFGISNKELLKQMAEEGLLSPGKEQNTKSIRINEKSKRLACIYKSKAQQIYDGTL